MKKGIMFLIVFVVALGFSMQADAALSNRGTDSLGNRLIYDSDLNITWYDYTKSWSTWDNQVSWASGLSVSGGDLVGVYDNWRLPSTVYPQAAYGYNGMATAGYNMTNSEMSYLFYTELGNKGYVATNGTYPQPGWGLTNTGDFQHLQSGVYWSGTEPSDNPNYAWLFNTSVGFQGTDNKYSYGALAIAVRPGDVSVAVAPEPVSMVLFGVGGVVLGARRKLLRRRG